MDAILDAAVACFDRLGIDATRMDDIASEAGLQRPNLYRYFANKDAIIVEVILRDISRLSVRLRQSLRLRGPARKVLLSALKVVIPSLQESRFAHHLLHRPEHIRTIVHLAAASDTVFESAVHSYWAAIFEYAERRGELRDDIDPRAGIRWIIFVMLFCFLYPEALGSEDELSAYLETFVVDAMLKRSAD
ncbi:MAG TPA: helix-turn-helix domain-containing protein [Acidimicrobiia bacterium]|nr:helix-turn-helix domain-containing protein [Acidimicrobiia bacterium]